MSKKYIPLDKLPYEEKINMAKALAKIKVLLIDVDGTLKRGNKSIEENTLAMLKKAADNGIECVITTSNPRAEAQQWYNDKLGIGRYDIFAGGTEVYDFKEQGVIKNYPLDNKFVKQLYNIADKYNSMTPEQRARISPKFKIDDANSGLKIKFIGGGKSVSNLNGLNEPITQVVISCDNSFTYEYLMKNIKGTMSKPYYEQCTADSQKYRISDVQIKNTNKGEAGEFLFNHLNLKNGEMAVVGNDWNDREIIEKMPKLNGMSFAVGNASTIAAEASDFCLSVTNEEGAVGFLIGEILNARNYLKEQETFRCNSKNLLNLQK